MTKEEAIKYFQGKIEWAKQKCYPYISKEEVEIFETAIEALKREPCEDAISRQAVRHILNHEVQVPIKVWKKLYILVDDLPSVNPQEKTGHWITWKEAENEIASETRFECSVCHDAAQTLCNGLDLLSPYCPNCGARMVEQERSDKE